MPTAKKTAAPKAGTKPDGAVYSFTEDGQTYHLPAINEGVADVPGRYTIDAVLHPENEMAQTALGFAMLKTADIPPDVRAVLENLPTGRLLTIVREWMGESRGSSAS
ncbi:hypothetical protein GCM10023340_08530 [Nocardioides marinquilinus]|uniref:Uncharacterized protein n=1 Tax=Nocardioides marinquilinus TaxID=1210400 RepID=A0ABP9PAE7_9ACTN